MDELANLRGQLGRGSRMSSSPWSTVGSVCGATAASPPTDSFHGCAGELPPTAPRVGRDGSRTPRNKGRNETVSPPRSPKRGVKHTPNGTRVPDGPPPDDVQVMPPLPPLPCTAGFDPGLYEAVQTGNSVKQGNLQWKPNDERPHVDRNTVLTPSEAKQVWLEREVQSMRDALSDLQVPPSFRNSDYWSGRFQGLQSESQALGGNPHDGRASTALRSQHGGALGDDRALHQQRLHAASAASVHGELPEDGRAWHQQRSCSASVLGEHRDGARAEHGGHLRDDRASHAHELSFAPALGDVPGQARANYDAARAPGHQDQGRAFQRFARDSRDPDGPLPEQDRAPPWHGLHSGTDLNGGELHACGRGRSGDLPRHGGGGGFGDGGSFGGGMNSGGHGWSDSMGTTANTKAELAELPSNASPLQFGDWLHLCGPTMRDISGVASRWWDITLRHAKAFYATWKESTPLQRVQLAVGLPDELQHPNYLRTEQRGIQMLLRAVPATEQQGLIAERALSSTAILYRLMIRFQPGGAGEKQILLKHLTSIEKGTAIAEVADGLRTWRRHYSRAAEVGAALLAGWRTSSSSS